MRLRKKHWAIPELQANKLIYFEPEDNKGNWNKVFGNDNPIYLDIGAGKGDFTLISATNNPNINYIALEIEANAFVYAGRKFLESELENIRGIRTDAENLLEFFETDEIDRIYINFCNPWPKNRQHKRRLSHPNKLALYKRILKNKGEIELKTDDRPFFEDTIKYFEDEGFEILEIDNDLDAEKDGNIITAYESKWRSRGVKINYIRARLNK